MHTFVLSAELMSCMFFSCRHYSYRSKTRTKLESDSCRSEQPWWLEVLGGQDNQSGRTAKIPERPKRPWKEQIGQHVACRWPWTAHGDRGDFRRLGRIRDHARGYSLHATCTVHRQQAAQSPPPVYWLTVVAVRRTTTRHGRRVHLASDSSECMQSAAVDYRYTSIYDSLCGQY